MHKYIHHMSVCFSWALTRNEGQRKRHSACEGGSSPSLAFFGKFSDMQKPLEFAFIFPYMSSLKPSWTSTQGPPAMMPTLASFADWYTASDSAPGCSQMFFTPALACGEERWMCKGRELKGSAGLKS
jgi:hypothetical protein